MGKLQVKIPIGDWEDEALADEVPITSEEDVMARLDAGEPTARVARMAVVWRELKQAPADIIRPNKILLHSGAQADVSRIARKAKHVVETPSGRSYSTASFVGAVARTEEEENGESVDEPSYVRADDHRARERAEEYLLEIVPGHIWPRLLLVCEQGGNVQQIADKLKASIDEMVTKILTPEQ